MDDNDDNDDDSLSLRAFIHTVRYGLRDATIFRHRQMGIIVNGRS